MILSELWDTFARIPEPTDPGIFSCTAVDGLGDILLGKDASGSPCMLLKRDPAGAVLDTAPFDISLRHLVVNQRMRCRVVLDSSSTEDDFTLIRCVDASEELMRYFVSVLSSVLQNARVGELRGGIVRILTQLMELFSALESPGTGTVVGLWAELFLAVYSVDPAGSLRAWHAKRTERYDFACGSERIDAKSSVRGVREHHFSYEQVSPPEGASVVIASVITQPSAGGKSLGQLWDEARLVVRGDSDLSGRVERVCAQTLGVGWEVARKTAFDLEMARHSLAFYAATDIPSIRGPLPHGVSKVSFVSSLEHVAPLRPSDWRLAGPLCSGIVHRR